MEVNVEKDLRIDAAANHTATHLLYAALKTVLGDHVKQAGSYVGPDRLRFDYTTTDAPSQDVLVTIQNIVNEKIKDIEFVYLIADDYPPKLLKQFVDDQKNKYKQKCVSLIISKNDNKLSIVLGATNDLINNFDSSKIIQDVSIILGGKGGGGRKDLAQAGGLSLDNINKAITKIKKSLEF